MGDSSCQDEVSVLHWKHGVYFNYFSSRHGGARDAPCPHHLLSAARRSTFDDLLFGTLAAYMCHHTNLIFHRTYIQRVRRADPATDLSCEQRVDIWLHISNMSLSPYAPFFRKMSFVEEDVAMGEIQLLVCMSLLAAKL